MLKYLTSGESHGKALSAIIEGLPANLAVNPDFINAELSRRQLGFGRGGRMKIEQDQAQILSGVRGGITIGSPVAVLIKNKDWENWQDVMDSQKKYKEEITTPRPGHADLAGAMKTGMSDLRNILERSSARQTAAIVAIGALAKLFLAEFGVQILSQVSSIGSVKANTKALKAGIAADIDNSAVRTTDKEAEAKMVEIIKEAAENGDTLGGTFEVAAIGVVAGLGGYSVPGKRLDARLCKALVSIPAVKGAIVGEAARTAFAKGSQAHDEIYFEEGKGYYRKTNMAGGIEGGLTNGSDIILKGYMKPIPTLSKPLKSVEMKSKKAAEAFKERHDTVAVPAAAVIGEAVVALELADVFLEKFGTDNLTLIKQNYQNYLVQIKSM